MSISIEISAGELVDKITILVIKLERMSDSVKLFNVQRDYDMLMEVYRNAIDESDELIVLRDRLREVNAKLWDIEDELREFERNQDFGEGIVRVARSAYRTNDLPSSTSRQI